MVVTLRYAMRILREALHSQHSAPSSSTRTSRCSILSKLRLKSMHGLAQRTLNCMRVNVALSLAARILPCSQQQCAPPTYLVCFCRVTNNNCQVYLSYLIACVYNNSWWSMRNLQISKFSPLRMKSMHDLSKLSRRLILTPTLARRLSHSQQPRHVPCENLLHITFFSSRFPCVLLLTHNTPHFFHKTNE